MRSALTLGLFLLFGCQAAAPEVKKDEVASSPGLLVAMERGACFGRCPVYKVEVFTDGLVRFTGERNVKATEPVEAKLTAAQVAAIADRLKAIDFKWVDYQQQDITDQSTVTLTYQGKTIRHYEGDQRAPGGLKRLEDALDELIGTEKWINGETADR